MVPQLYKPRDIVKLFVVPTLDPNMQYETVNAIVLAIIWDDSQFLYYLGIDLRSVETIGHSVVTVSYENIFGRANQPSN